MRNSILTLQEEIRGKFVLEADGKVFAKSIRSVASFANVSEGAVRKLLETLRIKECPKTLKAFTGEDLKKHSRIASLNFYSTSKHIHPAGKLVFTRFIWCKFNRRNFVQR